MAAPTVTPRLSVTAQYTAGVWSSAGFPSAELFVDRDVREVYRWTEAVLGLAHRLVPTVPSLRAGLVHRRALIDDLLREAGPTLILELAAGLSPRGAAFTTDPARTFIEVDLPEVIAQKARMLAASEAGVAVAGRPNLRRVAADVLTTPLADLAAPDGPAAVVAEGLMVYLRPEERRHLFAEAAGILRARGGVLLFDLVPGPELPDAGRVGRALGWLFSKITRGARMQPDVRTRGMILDELRAAGFGEVEAIEPWRVAAARGLPMAGVVSSQVVFRAVILP
jgi:O-methyltransferase involved in polyketide biosynthesis